jgi:diguanylate cyclase (GGDEF)-like protein
MVSWSMAVPMKKKKKQKLSVPKAVKRLKGARAGTKPDQAGRVKRGKARSKSPRPAAPADPKLTIRRLRSQLAEAQSRIGTLEAAADQDFLLDIPNRRGFERELKRSIAYIKRYHASGALIVLDVDRLKPINDAYGHAAGDEVLKAVVAVLRRHVRSSDVIGRLGGDEFALLLWNLSETDAHAKAASLEQAVDGLSFVFRGRRIAAGASAGVAVLGPHAEASKALEEADSAMYVRKAQRRHEG